MKSKFRLPVALAVLTLGLIAFAAPIASGESGPIYGPSCWECPPGPVMYGDPDEGGPTTNRISEARTNRSPTGEVDRRARRVTYSASQWARTLGQTWFWSLAARW